MLPNFTRRRSFAGALLVLGGTGLAIGIWQQNIPLSLLGIAFWMATLIGIGVRVIQRVNAILQLSRANHYDIQQLAAAKNEWVQLKAAQRESIDLVRKCLKEVSQLPKQLESRISKQVEEQFSNHLKEEVQRLDALYERSTATEGWHQRHSEQFADFVGSIAEWLAIAEVEAKQSVAETIARQASAVEEGVGSLLQRFDQVDGRLASLDETLPARQASVVEVGVGSLLQRFDQVEGRLASLDETIPARQASAVEAGVGSLLQRFDHVEGRLAKADEAAATHSDGMKSISKTVTSMLPSQKAELARSRIASVKEVEAIFQLRAFLATDKPMPLLGGWAMDPVSMLALVQELAARRPRLVLECGAGTSTLWIGKALKRMGMGRLVSLEHLKPYHASTARALLAAELQDWVDLRLAPLQTHRIGSEKFRWYDLEQIDLPEKSVDFLVIDGPPKDVGPFARYPALPLLERLLADDAMVVLDDANRSDETEEIARWLREFPGLQEVTDLGERTKMFTYSNSDAAMRTGSVHLKAL